jgi:diguanylate cyclase (GGDEF)-like protein
MRNIVESRLIQPHLALDFTETLGELLLRLENTHPHIILICASAENALQSLDTYSPLLKKTCTPVVLVDAQITEEEGDQLLNASFSDFISLNDATDDTFNRSIRLLTQINNKNTELRTLYKTDTLTSLKNRSCFYSRLQFELDKIQLKNDALALISLDIDNFKAFNQRMGVAAGDQVLLDLKNRLQNCARLLPVYRTGADEFFIIITATTLDTVKIETNQLLEAMVGLLFASFNIADQENVLGISIGITFSPENGFNIDALTNQANQARSRAKRTHGCSFSIYEPEKDQAPPYEGLLETDLWTALKKEQFELYYQPRIDLNSGEIVGAEALMRWHHPDHGLIMPDDFIPISEHTGQIVPMGYWAIFQSGKDLKAIQDAGLSLAKLGVNLSFRQFQDEHLVQTIHQIIDKENIDTRILEFELTESALFSDDLHVQNSIEALSKIGIDFSLDDFGTGYSSFALLQKLPISALKIDRSFVTRLPDSPGDVEIVLAIINLAHNLNMSVIAEGVETQPQLDFLIKNGCDQVQGHYFSPPIPLKAFMKMLKTD